ncbi:hypothetical protein ACFODO_11000 [Acinetobacter sichuanensis]|uniref:DUF1311 domain-containing protein n=1 Tax=Acinetobacter sichuanensis TaxID=2136183 RepID=A0A371YIU0_9GAMM|nr:hypothetical protein [Acinetobacter sichuanensis]RFC81388.1 hypothetical protein C9E89_022150 [Acinetobacter sichuanensis]
MKNILLIFLTFFISSSVFAENFLQSKKQVRNYLVSCLKDPENSKYSAAYNSCLLEASDKFLEKANIEFSQQFTKANITTRNSLVKDRNIYLNAIKFCESYQAVSYDGFTKEAICKLKTAKDYLSLLVNGETTLPNNWKIEDRVDKLFIGY